MLWWVQVHCGPLGAEGGDSGGLRQKSCRVPAAEDPSSDEHGSGLCASLFGVTLWGGVGTEIGRLGNRGVHTSTSPFFPNSCPRFPRFHSFSRRCRVELNCASSQPGVVVITPWPCRNQSVRFCDNFQFYLIIECLRFPRVPVPPHAATQPRSCIDCLPAERATRMSCCNATVSALVSSRELANPDPGSAVIRQLGSEQR